MHPRNVHRQGYDFAKLMECCAELIPFVMVNKHGTTSIDFSNADAVKMLNKALLQYFYNVSYWDIPSGYLCPPIPGRADYIHYIADLIADADGKHSSTSGSMRVLDIGVGANCAYPLIGHGAYGWQFVGTDISPEAIGVAQKIIKESGLSDVITLRLQTHAASVYSGVIKEGEVFDVAICNPPFHASLADAKLGTDRKWKNLGLRNKAKSVLNFGGQQAELWCKGGELSFIKNMIQESAKFPSSCLWYTTLVSKSGHLDSFYQMLAKMKAVEVKTIAMAQGQKVSRILAWTFLSPTLQKEWANKRW